MLVKTSRSRSLPDKQQTIGVVEGRSLWRLAPEHVDLLAKNQDLRFTPRAGLEQSNERTPKQSEQLDHRATAPPDSHRFASCMEFAIGTGESAFGHDPCQISVCRLKRPRPLYSFSYPHLFISPTVQQPVSIQASYRLWQTRCVPQDDLACEQVARCWAGASL